MLTLFLEHPKCETCQMTKTTRARCRHRRRCAEIFPRSLETESQRITKVLSGENAPRLQHRCAVEWCKTSFLIASRGTEERTRMLATRRKVCNSSCLPLTDLDELTLTIRWSSVVLAKIYSRNHDTSTPFRSEANGMAERAVRRVEEGTASVVVESGQTDGGARPWNAIDTCETYRIPWPTDTLHIKKRFNATVNSPIIPFGAGISHKPISAMDKTTSSSVWQQDVIKHISGIRPACWRWMVKRDMLVADWYDLNKHSASEVHVKRLNDQEVQVKTDHGNTSFHVLMDFLHNKDMSSLDLSVNSNFKNKTMTKKTTPSPPRHQHAGGNCNADDTLPTTPQSVEQEATEDQGRLLEQVITFTVITLHLADSCVFYMSRRSRSL